MSNDVKYITDNTFYTCDYFYIIKQDYKNRKTSSYHIFDYKANFLGDIKWYVSWRRYCFFPNADTVWDLHCLDKINEQLKIINDNYKGGLV